MKIDATELITKLNEAGGCGAKKGTWADGWDKAIAEAIKIVQALEAEEAYLRLTEVKLQIKEAMEENEPLDGDLWDEYNDLVEKKES